MQFVSESVTPAIRVTIYFFTLSSSRSPVANLCVLMQTCTTYHTLSCSSEPLQVCVLALHLAKELCRTDEDGEHWVSVMRRVPVLPSVLSTVELSLRSKQNLYFTEAALHLLLTLTRTPQVSLFSLP